MAVEQVLTAYGWVINTAFVERLNLSLRQRVAAIRRRSATSCKSADGLDCQLAVF
jgi:IS1 family transposase